MMPKVLFAHGITIRTQHHQPLVLHGELAQLLPQRGALPGNVGRQCDLGT